jgi:hypothetical protein
MGVLRYRKASQEGLQGIDDQQGLGVAAGSSRALVCNARNASVPIRST